MGRPNGAQEGHAIESHQGTVGDVGRFNPAQRVYLGRRQLLAAANGRLQLCSLPTRPVIGLGNGSVNRAQENIVPGSEIPVEIIQVVDGTAQGSGERDALAQQRDGFQLVLPVLGMPPTQMVFFHCSMALMHDNHWPPISGNFSEIRLEIGISPTWFAQVIPPQPGGEHPTDPTTLAGILNLRG